jgi:type IV pilus assembly protein PilN
MIRINLLPVREARRRADLHQQVLLLGFLLGLGIAVVGFMHFSITGKISDANERVASTQAQIKQFEPQLKKVEEYKKKRDEVQAKLDVIYNLDASRSGPVRVMDELATKTPERMWITKLQSKGPSLKIEGMSLDNEIVAVFLTELANSPYFGEVELSKTELQAKGGLKLNHFEATAQLLNPDAPKAGDNGENPQGQGTPAEAAGQPSGAAAGQ